MEWTHGKHHVHYNEIALRQDQADFAAWSLHRATTFLMAVAIKDAIKDVIDDPKNHPEQNVRSAYQISRLIRNAFTHAPFNPIWSIDPDCWNKMFSVDDLISLDTIGLHDKPFDLPACRIDSFEAGRRLPPRKNGFLIAASGASFSSSQKRRVVVRNVGWRGRLIVDRRL